ncbi:MAG: cation-translocating P-type ATPase [Dehalococcoidia bacterium]
MTAERPASASDPPAEDLARLLATSDLARGLTQAEAEALLDRWGPNDPAPVVGRSWRHLLLRQLRSAIIIVLVAAMLASFALGEWVNGIAIAISIVASVALGFAQEFRSEQAISALRNLTALRAEVVRDGRRDEVSALAVVPGDLVVVDEGDTVPADALVIESHGLLVNEAVLTGEALPVEKEPQPVEAIRGLAAPGRLSAGTTVVAGFGRALVYATGGRTALGGIFTSLGEEREHVTPLERRLESLGRRLVVLFLVLTAVLTLVGVAQGRDLRLTVEMAVALAIGAVPEGLPAVATTTLAVAVRRLAARRVLVRRLNAVETLGSTTVIVSDKTGTLTENRMVVRAVLLPSGERWEFPRDLDPAHEDDGSAHVPAEASSEAARVLLIGALCGEAVVEYDDEDGWHAHGDPLEAAISYAAASLGWHTDELQDRFPRRRTTPFTPERRYMRTEHHTEDGPLFAVKGAPAQVFAIATGDQRLLEATTALGEEGYRVLAVAAGSVESDLEVIGAIVLEDPLRADAAAAVAASRAAGLRLMLATGDQLTTAATIARESGLLREGEAAVEASTLDRAEPDSVTVVARATHDQKVALVARLQQRGEVVAMLGDGVNDAPALRAADVGVAVGPGASDVAVEASEVILSDGRLASLVDGIREGRTTALNLRRAIVYLLTASFATIGAVGLALFIDDELPLGPIQILWLNLVVHVFPAIALATGRGVTDIGGPTRTLLARATWAEIGARAVTVALVAAALFAWAVNESETIEHQQTLVFMVIAACLLGQSFLIGIPSLRALPRALARAELWYALAMSAAFVLFALYTPFMRAALEVEIPSASDWALVVALGFVAGNLSQFAVWLARHTWPEDEEADGFPEAQS